MTYENMLSTKIKLNCLQMLVEHNQTDGRDIPNTITQGVNHVNEL